MGRIPPNGVIFGSRIFFKSPAKIGQNWWAEGLEKKMWKHSRKQEQCSIKPHKRTLADGCWKPQRQKLRSERLISQWHAHCVLIMLFVMHAYLAAHLKWWCVIDSCSRLQSDLLSPACTLCLWFTCESSWKVCERVERSPSVSSGTRYTTNLWCC